MAELDVILGGYIDGRRDDIEFEPPDSFKELRLS